MIRRNSCGLRAHNTNIDNPDTGGAEDLIEGTDRQVGWKRAETRDRMRAVFEAMRRKITLGQGVSPVVRIASNQCR